MNTTRRQLLAGSGTAAVAGLAGCAGIDRGFVTGESPATFGAAPATVADAVLQDTGYELDRVEEDVVTREFEVGGVTREVEVTNVLAEYDRAVELLGARYRAAVFTVLSTPQVNVLGRTFNPVADMDRDDLAERIQEQYEHVENVDFESEYTTTLLGQETSVGQYSARGRLAGANATIDLVLHISDPVESGDDFVVGIGGYPEILSDGDAVRHLLNGIEHDAE